MSERDRLAEENRQLRTLVKKLEAKAAAASVEHVHKQGDVENWKSMYKKTTEEKFYWRDEYTKLNDAYTKLNDA